jgi:pilus assembly protein CpaC
MNKKSLCTILSTGLRKTCGAVALGGLLFLPMAVVGAPQTLAAIPAHVVAAPEMLKLTLGKAEVYKLPKLVSDIMVANPKIADVSALQLDQLYIVGSTLGDTNIIILDNAGNVLKNLNVNVSIDVSIIENLIHTVFPQEKGVSVHVVGNQVALMGTVSTPVAAQRIAKLVAAHMSDVRKDGDVKNIDSMIENLLEVRGQQQVTLRVRILEVSRTVLKELGINTATGVTTSTTGFRPDLKYTKGTGLTKDPMAAASLLFSSGFKSIGDIGLFIDALESDGLANILAEPNLTAVSGEDAGFLAGGEFPIPAGRDQNGNIIIDYKKFGVSLNFKPTVMSDDRISLQLSTEVSSLDQAQGLTLSDIQIPGLDVRRASTTVEINSGGSLMMAGLLKASNTKGLSGIPGIKDTPVLGDLMSSRSFQREETELVVIVTPYLVQPYADAGTAAPQPIDESELGELMPPPPPTAAMTPPDKGKPKALYSQAEAKKMADDAATPKVPVQNNAPMSKVFTKNMQKIYGDRLKNVPTNSNQAFGYMLD